MADAILTVNAGSSSIKFALHEANSGLACIASGEVQNIGTAPNLKIRAGTTVALARRWQQGESLSHEALFASILNWVETHLGDARLIAAGHRIVHGGAKFTEPTRLDDKTLTELAKLNPLAPPEQPKPHAP